MSEEGLITAVGEGLAVITATTHNGLTAECSVQVYTAVEEIAVSGTSATLWPIDGLNRLQLAVAVAPQNAAFRSVSWTSSAPDIATVDENGLVTALAPDHGDVRRSVRPLGKLSDHSRSRHPDNPDHAQGTADHRRRSFLRYGRDPVCDPR